MRSLLRTAEWKVKSPPSSLVLLPAPSAHFSSTAYRAKDLGRGKPRGLSPQSRRDQNVQKARSGQLRADEKRQLEALERFTNGIKSQIARLEEQERLAALEADLPQHEVPEEDVAQAVAHLLAPGIRAATSATGSSQTPTRSLGAHSAGHNQLPAAAAADAASQSPAPASSTPQHPSSPSGKDLFYSSESRVAPLLLERVGEAVRLITSPKRQNWPQFLRVLHQNGGLTDATPLDARRLVNQIPSYQLGASIPIVYEMCCEAGLLGIRSLRDFVSRKIMEGYAEKGAEFGPVVDAFYEMRKADKMTATSFVFSIAIKSAYKANSLARATYYLQEMSAAGMQPTLRIYTMLIQLSIRNNNLPQAQGIFDSLKYRAVEELPDLRLYNTMLSAYGKQDNIEKCLDLFKEMTTRPVKPLQPDVQTYIHLIYACARRPEFFVRGWEFIVEAVETLPRSLEKRLVQAVCYLAGQSGDLPLVRVIFARLYENGLLRSRAQSVKQPEMAASLSDAVLVSALMAAYSTYDPRNPPVAHGVVGGKAIRDRFFYGADFTPRAGIPPFLPRFDGLSSEAVLAESRAVVGFLHDAFPELVNERVVHGYLRVCTRLRNIQEYKRRWEEETFFAGQAQQGKNEERRVVKSERKVQRTHELYCSALIAGAECRDLEFGQSVWTERGMWRKTVAFTRLPRAIQERQDFEFARKMVILLTACGKVEEALAIVASSKHRFAWNMGHVFPLYQEVVTLGHEAARLQIREILEEIKQRSEGRAVRDDEELEELDMESLEN